ncbi:ABC transporter ATP-binding protein [Halapricum desulfuricans]|uniref:Cobalamin import ATP-binding protein BtuD n=1 Tax=Halapricum desulfuricans TaxID=2841257 RepID=A0A897NFX5_9EURY|nr:ABC transporter ATP-binding protein [Halapricum desulfuricans]QSG09662.1 ABC-type cobalamin/Fe3+-siderophores transport system, ATPase component [Halapricum desulfuricans]QSG11241.1 ABC-type cobalamin/Fe3+-siderophores transport system, ATPase component [Halapricum desulfuricans]
MTITVRDATLAYDTTPVLEDVSLRVEDGQLLGLLGPNGVGKTSLLRAIDGLLEPERGQITLDGVEVDDLSRKEIARQIGYLPQVERAETHSTVFETVLLGRTPHFGWRPDETDRQAVQRALERLGIADLATRPMATLSGGQRRTALLARALVGGPEALLLDEPTSGLDLKHQHEVMGRLRSAVHESDRAGVVAIHDLDLATRFCDRYALLSDGGVFAAGGKDVLTAEAIETVYDIPVEVVTRNGHREIVPTEPDGGW